MSWYGTEDDGGIHEAELESEQREVLDAVAYLHGWSHRELLECALAEMASDWSQERNVQELVRLRAESAKRREEQRQVMRP